MFDLSSIQWGLSQFNNWIFLKYMKRKYHSVSRKRHKTALSESRLVGFESNTLLHAYGHIIRESRKSTKVETIGFTLSCITRKSTRSSPGGPSPRTRFPSSVNLARPHFGWTWREILSYCCGENWIYLIALTLKWKQLYTSAWILINNPKCVILGK